MSTIPNTRAQTTVTVETYPHIALNPNPVGVNQTVLVDMWTMPIEPEQDDRLSGYMLTITSPTGSKQTFGPYTANIAAGAALAYTPNQVGTYTLQLSYPGNNFTDANEYYLPGESPVTNLTVQQQPIPPYTQNPLPTSYWTSPIDALNQNWYSISGNWLERDDNSSRAPAWNGLDNVGAYQPSSTAPLSAHIMWTKPIEIGGLVGGDLGSQSYYNGFSYGPEMTPPIVINGNLYYNIYTGDYAQPGFVCVDLRTGQQLWQVDNDTITNGQLWNYAPTKATSDQVGVWPFLWSTSGSTWNVYDPSTGRLLVSFTNAVTGGMVVYGSDGTMYYYVLDGIDGWLAMWNSTLAFQANGMIVSDTEITNDLYPIGTYDWSSGIQWNVTTPLHIVNTNFFGPPYPTGPAIVGTSGNTLIAIVDKSIGDTVYAQIGYSMTTGQQLWYNNATNVSDMQASPWQMTFGDGIFAVFLDRTMTWTAWDANTGKQLWTSQPADYPFGSYIGYNPTIANGALYWGSFSGYEYALNITNGQLLWKCKPANVTNAGSVYGTYPFWYGPIIADGVVFAGTGEETPNHPLAPGYKLYAINETTGTPLWNITGMMDMTAIADGYLVAYNGYDSSAYVFGMGPSKTTVTAPDVGVIAGAPVTITGTVMDISAGSQQQAVAANFPNGLPCVSDASESAFMEAVYEQQPMPTDVTGVQVTLTAIDPNHNFITLGTTTTNNLGDFGFSWTPPSVPGNYQIIATFSGTNSYYGSDASTYCAVQNAPATAAPTTAPATGLATASDMIIGIAAIIIVIVIIGAVLAMLMLRKRP
jgi:outer membrane protein assembly factor BamB